MTAKAAPRAIVVAGTDTDVGKTVFAAALAGALDADYWKPIQSGTRDGGDSRTVAVLSGLPRTRILPEAYRLTESLSPHRAAELDGVVIDPDRLALPLTDAPLVVEGAGGLMVPLTRDLLQVDLFALWQAPVVLVARTALGTINHSLLSVEALRARNIPVVGIAFVGDANEDSEQTIAAFAGAKRLGRLPRLPHLDATSLRRAFAENFKVGDFA
ncbi:MAG: dethiobiotin synthase [Hyphomicrobium sp.]|nr:dethiobiotin synthase [Hyphomicrobium sp.]